MGDEMVLECDEIFDESWINVKSAYADPDEWFSAFSCPISLLYDEIDPQPEYTPHSPKRSFAEPLASEVDKVGRSAFSQSRTPTRKTCGRQPLILPSQRAIGKHKPRTLFPSSSAAAC